MACSLASFRCRTYTTDYAGSVAVDHSAEAGAVGAEPAWEPTNEGMDRSMLMARDPILFWDEIPLYESELDDNGVSQLRVKARLTLQCSAQLQEQQPDLRGSIIFTSASKYELVDIHLSLPPPPGSWTGHSNPSTP